MPCFRAGFAQRAAPAAAGGGGAGGAIDFHSTWNHTTGRSINAFRDGAGSGTWRWDGNSSGLSISDGSEVLPAGTVPGFPASANVLKVVGATGGGFPDVATTAKLAVPAIGQSRFYRIIFQLDQTLLADVTQHPIQDGGSSFSEHSWGLYTTADPDPDWYLNFRVDADNNPATHNSWGCLLTKFVPQRIEWQIHRTATEQFQMHARVYNSAGALLKQDADFTTARAAINGTLNLAGTGPGQGGVLPTFNANTPNGFDFSMRFWKSGCNGMGGAGLGTAYAHESSFATGLDTWIGDYRPAEED